MDLLDDDEYIQKIPSLPQPPTHSRYTCPIPCPVSFPDINTPMIPVNIQHFPMKISKGSKYNPIQTKLSNNNHQGIISIGNRSTPRNCRGKRKGLTPTPQNVHYVSKVQSRSCLNNPKNEAFFCYSKWDGQDIPPAPIEGGVMEDIACYTEIDSSDCADAIVMDDHDATFIVAKMSWLKS